MADQTVKLKLTGDTRDLRKELDQTGREMDDLGKSGTDAGADIERAVSGSETQVRSLKDTLGEAGLEMGALAGAVAGLGIGDSLNDAVVSSGRLQAQLGLTSEEAEQFDRIAKDVYADNFGDTMGQATQVVGQVHQSLGLTGQALQDATEDVFAVADAFGHLGADTDIVLEDVRAMTANFPGLDEQRALDLIARGFQDGAGSAGDLQDTLQEYPGDFARLGLEADDMFGILTAGMEAGARNTDIVADAVREMGIRITTAGDTGQQALANMFPADEAQRLIGDFAAGGEAGREAFYTILDGLTSVQDPQDRYNLAVELMGTRGEELANVLPGMRDALLEVRDGTVDADGAAESLSTQYTGLRDTLSGFARSFETSVLGPIADVGGTAAEAATGIGTFALGLQGVGVDVGGLKSKLSAFRGFLLGPWGAALTAATIGVGLWVSSKQDAARRVDELRGSLDDATGALTDNTEAIAINRLQQDGAITAARELGISMDTLVGATLGVPGAMDEVDDAINRALGESDSRFGAEAAIQTLSDSVVTLRDDLGEATEASRQEAEAAAELEGRYVDLQHALDSGLNPAEAHHIINMQNAEEAANDTADAVDNAGDVYDDTAEQTMAAAAAVDEYIAANRRATDPVFALTEAIGGVDDAQRNYNLAVDQHGTGSAEATEASFVLMEALGELEAAALDGDLSFEEFDGQLQRWIDTGRITEEQADGIRGSVAEARGEAEQFQGEYVATLAADDQASAVVEALIGKLGRVQGTYAARLTMQAARYQERADGGPVQPDELYLVGEEGPEFVTFGQAGWVHDARTTVQMMAPPAATTTATSSASYTLNVTSGRSDADIAEQFRRMELLHHG